MPSCPRSNCIGRRRSCRPRVWFSTSPDHLDWHGSFAAYRDAKAGALTGRVGGGRPRRCGGLRDRDRTRTRRVGFTLGVPGDGELGIDGDVLVDRAFGGGVVAGRRCPADGSVGLVDALAAAALALAVGVAPSSVTAGLTRFTPAAHRGEVVETIDGVEFVDDSKATNPHAACAAIAARTTGGSHRGRTAQRARRSMICSSRCANGSPAWSRSGRSWHHHRLDRTTPQMSQQSQCSQVTMGR